jgi:Pyruvate/2-oxoacid:ferredoxin oxidoreductase delta subunit
VRRTYTVTDACTACGACLLTCPEHAFAVGVPLQVRHDRCTGCGECVEVCPADAVVEHDAVVQHDAVVEHDGLPAQVSA